MCHRPVGPVGWVSPMLILLCSSPPQRSLAELEEEGQRLRKKAAGSSAPREARVIKRPIDHPLYRHEKLTEVCRRRSGVCEGAEFTESVCVVALCQLQHPPAESPARCVSRCVSRWHAPSPLAGRGAPDPARAASGRSGVPTIPLPQRVRAADIAGPHDQGGAAAQQQPRLLCRGCFAVPADRSVSFACRCARQQPHLPCPAPHSCMAATPCWAP